MAGMTDNQDHDSIDSIANAEAIIERFGGIRPMANKMNVPVTTVQGWKKRNVIPGNRREEVMQAAQTNNVDLSDLMAGVANENTFIAEMRQAEERRDQAPEQEIVKSAKPPASKKPIVAARRRPADEDVQAHNEQMIAQMHKAQSMAFTKSAWFTVGFVTFVVGLSAVLLWPSKEQLDRNTVDIAKLQGEVSEMRERHSFLKDLIPGDIEGRIAEMQKQAQGIQQTVTGLQQRVETIATDVMDPAATMEQRLARLEQHAVELGAPAQLTAMLQKVQGLQQTVTGQQQLSSAIADLNGLLGSITAQGGDVDTALQQAQQEDDALGQTLQGVSPQDLKAASLLLGLAQFRSSMNRSAPFEEDLALLQNMLGDEDPELQAAITRLAPQAAKGVLTPEGLKGEFSGLAGDIVVSSLKGEDVSVREKAKARLNEILQVEKDGELITGTDTQATVARAQKMLDAGDIEGAIAELQSLEGEAAETAQPFVAQAEMTVVAQQLQDMLTGKVINSIQTAPGGALSGGGAEQLIREIKKMATTRTVFRDEASGFTMVEPKGKLAP